MQKQLLFTLIASVALSLTAAPAKLPERILSCYTGSGIQDTTKVKYAIEQAAKHGFNSVDVKIQGKEAGTYMKHAGNVEELYKLCRDHGMILQIYLYPYPSNGARDERIEAHKFALPAVDASGHEMAKTFCLADPYSWKTLFAHAEEFVKMHKNIPYASLKFDIETIPFVYSYDDRTWRIFCEKHQDFSVDTPAYLRYKELNKKDAVKKYQSFFRRETTKAIKNFLGELRNIDTGIMFGFMPYHPNKWITHCWAKSIATETVPGIIDDWSLYNGGYSEIIDKYTASVKKEYPNNVFIVWSRPNSYIPDDIAPSTYQSAARTDGYSIWTVDMLNPNLHLPPGYALPKPWTSEDYWKAYGEVNAAIRADIAAGTLAKHERIPMRPVKFVAPEINYNKANFPNFKKLEPVTTGKPVNNNFVLRGQSLLLIFAEGGKSITVNLENIGWKPYPINYALLDENGNKLRNEVIPKGAFEKFSVVAPETGIYRLLIAGDLNQYAITVFDLPYAVATQPDEAYYMLPSPLKRRGKKTEIPESIVFYVPGTDFNNPTVNIRTTAQQGYRVSLDDLTPVEIAFNPLVTFELHKGLVKFEFLTTLRDSAYTQDFYISFPRGKTHLTYPSPERYLKY